MQRRTPAAPRPASGRRAAWIDPATRGRYGALPPPFAVPSPVADQLLGDVAAVYDETAPDYDGHYTDAVAVAENRLVRRALLGPVRALPPDHLVVDLGCGTGLALRILPEIPRDAYLGIDISDGMLREARLRHPFHRFAQADLRRPIFRPLLLGRTIGLIVSLFGSACYQPDPLACLDRLLADHRDAAMAVVLFGPSYEPRAPEPRATRLVAPEIDAWLLDHRRRGRRTVLWPFSPRPTSRLIERAQAALERVVRPETATRWLTTPAAYLLHGSDPFEAGYYLAVLGPTVDWDRPGRERRYGGEDG